jgi:hypothetical protein
MECPLSGANRKTFTRFSLPLLNPKTEVEATSILPSLNVKTARSWRGILGFTHLAREGRMTVTIGRRELLAALGGAAVTWPLAARAQQTDQVRRVGVLMNFPSSDPEGKALLAEFTRHLAELGWTEGRNVRIDARWGGSNVDLMRTLAKELVGLQPDVLLATSTPTTAVLARETQTIPIVFTFVSRPDRLALHSEPVPSRRQHYWVQHD